MSQNKSVEEVVEEPSEWVKDHVAQKTFVNDFLRNTYGLDDDSLLNAGEVEELCEMIVYETLKNERQTSQEREREIVEEITSKIIGAIHNNSTSLVRNTNGRGYSYAESVYLNLLENEIHTILINTLTNPNKN